VRVVTETLLELHFAFYILIYTHTNRMVILCLFGTNDVELFLFEDS